MKYISVIAFMLFPIQSFAATYYYVNTNGEIATVEADTPEMAILIAPNRMPDSGVALDLGLIEPGTQVVASAATASPGSTSGSLGTGGSNTFHYVTVDGVTALVTAPDPQTALLRAPNRAPNSGVAINDGLIKTGMVVPSVD